MITQKHISTKILSEQTLSAYNDKGLPIVVLRFGAICAETNSYGVAITLNAC